MLLTLCIIILILYFIQWMKWHQAVPPKLEGYQYIPDCTIIIPFRNEAHHLPLLLQKLQLHLPDRWNYGSRKLDSALRIDTTGSVAQVLQDDFKNSYSLVVTPAK